MLDEKNASVFRVAALAISVSSREREISYFSRSEAETSLGSGNNRFWIEFLKCFGDMCSAINTQLVTVLPENSRNAK